MINRLQEISQTWEHLLHLSGGALNLKKSNWYVLFWDWKKRRPILWQSQPNDPTLTPRQSINNQTQTEVKEWIPPLHPEYLEFISPHSATSLTNLKYADARLTHLRKKLFSPTITASDTRIFHRSI
jgi:hypothetical protein